jgi:tRNA nucleotidyltransferase/poly(A) polymerase
MAYLDRTDNFIGALGVEAYRVGGSVRDELLGRRVKDADYMVRGVDLLSLGKLLRVDADTKVTPLSLRDGRQAGWRVARKGLGLIEVVLPRTEVSTGPGHRDFEIAVDPAITKQEDAKRRDFTFNALYKLVPDGPIADPTGTGLYDLQHRFIRTTHPDSFRDDPLRTLRALRFVSTLGYELTTDTREQMTEHAHAVTGLSANGYASGTVLDELCKLLMGQDPAGALRIARDTGVLATLLPELAPMLGFEQASRYHDMTTDEHTFKALETAAHVDAPLRVRMALLFHDAGKPESAWIGKDGRKHYYANGDTEDHEIVGARIWDKAAARLGAPRDLRDDVRTLILNHMVTISGAVKYTKVARERVRLGDAMLRDLYLHRMCDICGKGKPDKVHLAKMGEMERVRAEAVEAKVPASVKDLAINGNDLKNLGADGRKIGETLRAVLDEVVCQPNEQLRSRDWQLERARTLLDG